MAGIYKSKFLELLINGWPLIEDSEGGVAKCFSRASTLLRCVCMHYVNMCRNEPSLDRASQSIKVG